MAIQSPGQGVLAERGGIVTAVSDREIEVGERTYPLSSKGAATTSPVSIEVGIHREDNGNFLIFPIAEFSQMPAVKAGDRVVKGQLLARGVTHIYFQANVKIFAGLVLLVGMLMGIGSAAVYKHIPGYFPESVGVVGGIVGVLGGLGGFFNPIIFGYLLQATGIWTTCWTFLGLVVATCLVWMHIVIQRMPRPPLPVVQVDEVPAGLESR